MAWRWLETRILVRIRECLGPNEEERDWRGPRLEAMVSAWGPILGGECGEALEANSPGRNEKIDDQNRTNASASVSFRQNESVKPFYISQQILPTKWSYMWVFGSARPSGVLVEL